MQFYSAISDNESTDLAAAEVIERALAAMGKGIDLAFVFFTEHHATEAQSLVEQLWLKLDPRCVVGCSGEGVIGGEREIERQAGLSLLVATMPGVRAHPFHIAGKEAWQAVISDGASLRERIGAGTGSRVLIGFGDPFTTPMPQFLNAMESALPGFPMVGGLASSARRPGQNVVVRNDGVYHEGMVGVSLSGPVAVQTVVSQGCRPVGKPMVITKSHKNVIEQIGGKPTLQVLRDMVDDLPDPDKELLQNGLLVGQAISEYRERFGRGDFLVRNVVDIQEESGAVAVADFVRTGQTIQFHVRDAQTAAEDLSMMLESQHLHEPAAGGLLFSCNGRGQRLFNEPDHDICQARKSMPATPIAGFFAAGEIGPIGGKNFIHGHTASFAMFRSEK